MRRNHKAILKVLIGKQSRLLFYYGFSCEWGFKMILTCEQLYKSKKNPRINQLSLELLREYYETYLNPYIFRFEIKFGDSNAEEIELRFDKENFCHLLGVESILKYTIGRKDIWKYKGENGWNNIINGTINFELLRKPENKKRFNSRKDKYVFFYLLPQILHAPQGVNYELGNVEGGTNIDCEILLYNQYLSAYIHIGIKKNEELGYYRPMTFFVERVTEKNDGLKYINDQTKLVILKTEKTNYTT